MRERCDPASYFLSSPVVFWLLASLLARRPTEPCLPAGQGVGNSRRKSATKERRREIPAPQAPTKEGLDGVERTPRIRRTATRKRRRQAGPGCPELCDGAPWTQQPAAKRTPIHWLKRSGNQGEPCEPAFALVRRIPHKAGPTQVLPPAPGNPPGSNGGNGGPPPATTHPSRPPRRTARPTKGERPTVLVSLFKARGGRDSVPATVGFSWRAVRPLPRRR